MKFSFLLAMAAGATGILSVSSAQAQTLLRAATGTTVYESSQNTPARAAANLFDGTPTVGAATNLGGLFDGSNNTTGAAGGVDNDYAPIAAFDLGASFTVSGVGFSQNTGIGGTGSQNFTGVINIFALSATQYTNYIAAAPLIASQTTARAGGLVAPPAAGAYLATQALTITDQTNSNFTLYNLPASLTGEYYVLQFNNASATAGNTAGNFPGGEEFRFVQAPEPSSLAWLGIGLGTAVFFVRRRLSA